MKKIDLIIGIVIVTILAILVIFPSRKNSKNKFAYHEIYREPKIENLNLKETTKYGAVGNEEKIIRTVRFKNVTDFVEKKDQLPYTLLAGMMMEETTGEDLLPNAGDDGGFGVIHMQGSIAYQFGLRTYGNCKKLKCKEHGRALRLIIESNNKDRKKVYMFDDRLQPVLNIATAGKIMRKYMRMKPIPGYTRLESAVRRYAGKYNYRSYWSDVQANMRLLSDTAYMSRVERYFNQRNPNLRINGKPATFKDYIRVHQEQNYNYGLSFL